MVKFELINILLTEVVFKKIVHALKNRQNFHKI